MLSLTAAALYLVASALCWRAAQAARATGSDGGARMTWLAIGLLFVLLAISRGADFENLLRAALRAWLTTQGEYGVRRSIQAPFAAVLLLGGGVAGLALLLRPRPAAVLRSARALAWAIRCAAVMVGLVALRLVSFHATDALLYQPVHLNWLVDIGTTLAVAMCAWTYGRSAQAPAHGRYGS